MKRFFCTVCRKMKRVRQWPIIIENVKSETPNQRFGECNRHSFKSTRTVQSRRVS